MKILMASSYFMSHRGGLEIVAGMLFKEFADLGQEVVWMAGDITPPPKPVSGAQAVPFQIFNFVEDRTGVPFPIPAPKSLRTIIREVRSADVLVLHDCLYLSNILAFLAAKWRRIPTIIIQHTRFFPNDTPLVNAVIGLCTAIVTRPMLSCASQVVFVGEATRQFFRKVRFRSDPEVIFNGVDTKTFHLPEGEETVQDLRRQYGLPEDGVIILFVGRFVEKKGIQAMRRMAAMRPGWTWAFAGWGPIDPIRWNLSNVKVFSGLQGASLASLYRCCDLLALPSIGEGGFPLVVREALSSGVPAVCGQETMGTDLSMEAFVAAAPVRLDNEEQTANGFLSVIDDVLAGETERSLKGGKRRAFILSRYSWRGAAEQYLEIIERVVPQANTPLQQMGQTAQSGRS